MARTIVKGVKTFDVDIAQEFRELHRQNAELREDLNKQNTEMRESLTRLNESFKQEIQTLKESISVQTSAFEIQLGKLNDNMSRVLSQIADHESRITTLESKTKKQEIEDGVWNRVKGASLTFLTWAFWSVVIVSASFGVKPALKIFNLFAN